MNFTIRRLDQKDAETYRDLRLEALTLHPEAFGASADEFAALSIDDIGQRLSDLVVFGAFSASSMVAMGAYYQEANPKTKHTATVISIYTNVAFRGQGINHQIIEELAAHAKSNGAIQLYLGVGAQNISAKKSYENAGFKTFGIEPRSLFVNGQYIDEEIMVRFLDEAPKGQIE